MASIMQALTEGVALTWNRFSRFWVSGLLLTLAMTLYVFNDIVFDILGDTVFTSEAAQTLLLLSSLGVDFLSIVALILIALWTYTTALSTLRGSEDPRVDGPRMLWTLVFSVLYAFTMGVIGFGIILMMVIGISLAVTLGMAGSFLPAILIGMGTAVFMLATLLLLAYLGIRLLILVQVVIADTGQNPFAAMAASWKLSSKNVLGLFGLWVMISLLNFAGMSALWFGLVFTLPASYVVLAHYYEQLRAEREPVGP